DTPTPNQLIPLIDDTVTYGTPKGIQANSDAIQHVNSYIVAGGWFRGATAALRHYGDSMREYPSGCILALKELQEIDFVWGQNYVIEYGLEYTRGTKKIQTG